VNCILIARCCNAAFANLFYRENEETKLTKKINTHKKNHFYFLGRTIEKKKSNQNEFE